MNKAALHRSLIAALGAIAISGCAGSRIDEAGFVFSPDGRRLASHTSSFVGVGAPADVELVGHANVGIRIRNTTGGTEHRFHYGSSGKSYGVGISEMAWSPDGGRLAVNGTRGLEVIDLAGGKRLLIANPVNQFRWTSDSSLTYISGNISVNCISVNEVEPYPVLTRRLGPLDERDNALSPDAETVVFQQADHLLFLELANTNHVRQVKISGSFFKCLWDSAGDRCLFETLVSRSSPTNYYSRPQVVTWLAEITNGSFMDLSKRLPDLPGDEEFDGPLAFSANGDLILLLSSGGWNTHQYRSRNWLARFSPWALVDLEDVVGASFQAQSFSPRGDYLLFTTRNRRTEGRFDLLVSRVSAASGGPPAITSPRKIAEDQLRWLWYPDGKHLLVSDGFKFRTIAIDIP